MEIPNVNRLSGTDPDDLVRDYMAAKAAVEKAIKAISGVWPNGRDYQQGSIRQAMHEHAERCKLLRQVAIELETIAEGIDNQIGTEKP